LRRSTGRSGSCLAFTVRYGPIGQDGGTVGDYIDEVPPDAVVVLDNQGRTDVTVWGDLLTLTAHRGRLGVQSRRLR
jgi:regulator of RNase E activity RraA